MIKNKYLIAADIGELHFTAAVMDLMDKSILAESFCRSDGNIISNSAGSLKLSCHKPGLLPDRLPIAMSVPIDYEKGIHHIYGNVKYKYLYDLSINELLGKQLGIANDDILMNYDAECF